MSSSDLSSGERSPLETDGLKRPRLFPSYRLAISALAFWEMCTSALSQSNMGAALVCMIRNETDVNSTGVSWSKETQGWVHTTMFLSYLLFQLPSAHLLTYTGPKVLGSLGLATLGVTHVLIVPCSLCCLPALLVVRVLQGVSNAVATTAVMSVLGRWTPREDSTFLVGFAAIGAYFGFAFPFIYSSLACSDASLGWPSVFFATGAVCFLNCLVWTVFASDGPENDVRWASKQESDYVRHSLHQSIATKKIPWRQLFRSGPVYGIVLGQVGSDWLVAFFITVAPAFFTDVLHCSVTATGLVCGLPFLVSLPVMTSGSRLLDRLRVGRVLSTVCARRIAQGVASLVPAVCCVALALLPVSLGAVSMAVYAVAVACIAAVTAGWVANCSDLAPQLTGVLYAMSQSLALWVDVVVPVMVSYVTVDDTHQQWSIVFCITAAIQVVCFLGFCILSSGEVQPWAWALTSEKEYEYITGSDSDDIKR